MTPDPCPAAGSAPFFRCSVAPVTVLEETRLRPSAHDSPKCRRRAASHPYSAEHSSCAMETLKLRSRRSRDSTGGFRERQDTDHVLNADFLWGGSDLDITKLQTS